MDFVTYSGFVRLLGDMGGLGVLLNPPSSDLEQFLQSLSRNLIKVYVPVSPIKTQLKRLPLR